MLIFCNHLRCWRYEGPDMGVDKPIQFKTSLIEYLKIKYPEDDESDILDVENWEKFPRHPYHVLLSTMSGCDDNDIFRDFGSQCACSQLIGRLFFWQYKTLEPILIGSDCFGKHISDTLADNYKKLIDKDIRDGEKLDEIRKREGDEIERQARERMKVVHLHLLGKIQTCIKCKKQIDVNINRPMCIDCYIGTQKCINCSVTIPKNKYKTRCLKCYKKTKKFGDQRYYKDD